MKFNWAIGLALAAFSFLGCGGAPLACRAAPCANGGQCIDTEGGGYACLCASGYSGAKCEVNIDDCSSKPCFNGGTCTDLVNGFQCACAAGFSGAHCETNIACASAPCQNGGVCVDRDNGFACICPAGFAGPTCATNINDCSPNPCFNGGTCADGVNTFSCTCPTGYYGVQCEALIAPLVISSVSPLRNAISGRPYSITLARTGGTSASVWSIDPGSTNAAWLSIDAKSGVLSGNPPAAAGPVSVTIRIQEPVYSKDFAVQTFSFGVFALPPAAYTNGFEGACPDGWTLTGDWQCGVPSNVGPASAYSGTQCLATQIAGLYNNFQTWAGTTATSPDFPLSANLPATLSFRAWVDTEGRTYDGFTLQASVDGGVTFTTVTGVTPAYPLLIAGLPAWGGQQASLGWQLVTADLSPYAGKTVRLQFAFQSDSSGTFPGVYLDDVLVDY